MPDRDDIHWFKRHFQARIAPALDGTPLTVDLFAALACQETGEIWPRLRTDMPPSQVLALCVGDVIDVRADGTGRKAFPRNKAELLAHPRGDEMFVIARRGLIEMAAHVPQYRRFADNPVKFCRGYGLFQRDLQFFKQDPEYFLQRRYAEFDQTFALCLRELQRGLRVLGFEDRATLSDAELASVGIVYNTGRFRRNKGLRQGHFDGRRFYGERLFEFIRLAKTVAIGGQRPALPPPTPGRAIVPPASRPTATGSFFRVDTRIDPLRLRSAPVVTDPPDANKVADLPDGHPVRAFTGQAVNGFIEVETSLMGGLKRGFAAARFLAPDPDADRMPVLQPAIEPAQRRIAEAHAPRRPGSVTRRRDIATAHSLNEAEQPGRRGTDAQTLCAELATIREWLAVDDPAHKRYRPRDGSTFCNIYAHDYCHLAGVYLPRVWWTEAALVALAQNRAVQPLIGNTLREMRANDLFRWLRDFGPNFGWRETGTLTKLQQEANQGAIGLIVARRKHDGKPGHIVAVVSESPTHSARRDAAGEVIAPLQSQAGVVNFRVGTGRRDWWRDAQFAESAFWLHA